MPPIVHFVGHSSFAIEGDRTVLLADPWLSGRAFNDGWEMLSPARLDDDVRSRVTDVYLSHEHPDHFSPPSLDQLAGPAAPTIRVQTTRDGRVAAYCRRKEFAVAELPAHERVELAPGFDVVCGPHRHMDSWLLADVEGTTILNINDCSITDEAQAHRVRSITGPVEVLFTQFSYANWLGNPSESQRRREYGDFMLRSVMAQIEVLQPRYVVPFASFIRFCHQENAYLNEDLPSVRAVADHIRRHTDAEPVVLYPGDRWIPGKEHDTERSIARYEADEAAERVSLPPRRTVPLAELEAKARQQIERLRARNHMAATKVLEVARYLPPVRIRLWDLETTVELRSDHGISPTSDPPHVEMGSDSLAFCFEQDFGAETLYVNGRYRVVDGPEKLFFRHFYPAILNNQGFDFPFGAVTFLAREKLAWRLRAARDAVRARLTDAAL